MTISIIYKDKTYWCFKIKDIEIRNDTKSIQVINTENKTIVFNPMNDRSKYKEIRLNNKLIYKFIGYLENTNKKIEQFGIKKGREWKKRLYQKAQQ